MPIVTILSTSFGHGDAVAQAVAQRLSLRTVTEADIVAAAATRGELPEKALLRALSGEAGLLNRVTREQERAVAHLRAALLEALASGDALHHGRSALLLPSRLPQVLRVALVGRTEHRIAEAVASGLSERQAEDRIRTDDEALARWADLVIGARPFDSKRHDVKLVFPDIAVAQAVAQIAEHAQSPVLAPSPAAERALADARLGAEVAVRLAEAGHDVDVTVQDGHARIGIKHHALRLGKLQATLERLARDVPGVLGAEARPGPRYQGPRIYANIDLDRRSPVLLVDDEKEFVETLSERLQTRDFHTQVAYSGEEALHQVASEAPEVMVLDLKMPGIDGIEVLRRVRASHPDTAVIILTGHGSDVEEEQARALGCFAYLRKPVNIERLGETLRQAQARVPGAAAPPDREEA